jgi:hypothetical protein
LSFALSQYCNILHFGCLNSECCTCQAGGSIIWGIWCVFQIGSHIYAQWAWTTIHLFMLHVFPGWRCAQPLCPDFISWNGVLWTFCLGLPQTVILPICTPEKLRLQTWATVPNYYCKTINPKTIYSNILWTNKFWGQVYFFKKFNAS